MARNIFDNEKEPKRSIKEVTLHRKRKSAAGTHSHAHTTHTEHETTHTDVQQEEVDENPELNKKVSAFESSFTPDKEKQWEKEWGNENTASDDSSEMTENGDENDSLTEETEEVATPAPKRARKATKINVEEPEEVPMAVPLKTPEVIRKNTFVRSAQPNSVEGVTPKNERSTPVNTNTSNGNGGSAMPESAPRSNYRSSDDLQVDFKDSMNSNSRKTARMIWIVIIILGLGFLGYAMFAPAKAEVALTLQNVDSVVNETFKTEAATSTETAQLPLVHTKSLTITGNATLPLPPGGKTVEVHNKATGIVTMYNNTDKAFTLLINTRLENKTGLIYKTDKAITIPARSTKNGVLTPGSIEVGATASSSGEAYNLNNQDFTLPGLKGGDQYESIYARSKTAFEGGFDGTTIELTEDQKTLLKQQAQAKLTTAILDGVKGNSNGEYIAFASDIVLNPTYTQNAKSYIADQTITINAYSKADLEKLVNFSIGDTTKASLSAQGTGVYNLTGNIQASGIPSNEKLVEALRGISKEEAQNVLHQYPTIKEATISVSPFWKSELPLDGEKITITQKTE